jgi:glycosyltransferase involved in cell wall biosynthesis
MSAARTILFCTQSASAIGGVENWLDQLCSGLDSNRWRPIVALVRGSRAHDPDRFRRSHPALETVEIDGRGLPQDSRVRAVMRCVRRVDPAVFIPLVVSDAHEAAARLRAAGTPTRYLLTLHGNTPPQLLEAREMIPYADFSVAPGALTFRLLAGLGMPPDRLRYIPNGARERIAEPRARVEGEPLRLGYVGRLADVDKRIRDIVPFVHGLHARGIPFHLSIAGDGPERSTLADALASYPVTFLGALSSDQLYREVYPALDALLLFSESEAFGIALVEAMRHGVVPVSSAFVGCVAEEIVADGSSGLLFPVGDSLAAVDCIERLAAQPGLLARVSAEGRRSVEGKFSWSGCIQEWNSALQRCMELPARAVPPRIPQAGRAGSGRLDRMGAHPGVVDALRRTRVRLFGVPEAMHGGEEWPWTQLRHQPSELDSMRRLRESLDQPGTGANG